MRFRPLVHMLLLAATHLASTAQSVSDASAPTSCGSQAVCAERPSCVLRELTTPRDVRDCTRSINAVVTEIKFTDQGCEAEKAAINQNIEIRRAVLQQEYRQCLVAQQSHSLNCELWQACMSTTLPKLAPRPRGDSLQALGNSYVNTGDYGKAIASFKNALALRSMELGPEHPSVSETLEDIGSLYLAMGDLQQSAISFQRAIAIREKILGPADRSIIRLFGKLATAYDAMGDRAKAESIRQRAVASGGKSESFSILNSNDPITALRSQYGWKVYSANFFYSLGYYLAIFHPRVNDGKIIYVTRESDIDQLKRNVGSTWQNYIAKVTTRAPLLVLDNSYLGLLAKAEASTGGTLYLPGVNAPVDFHAPLNEWEKELSKEFSRK